MKRMPLCCTILCLALLLSGCNSDTQEIAESISEDVNDLADRFFSSDEEEETEETASVGTRVYMDEITGTLTGFDGSQVTVVSDEETYVFDVSQATLECEYGMLSGSEVSVIYEGKLEGTDTDAVQALKVVDNYYNREEPKEKTGYGKVVSLTPNALTVKTKAGNTVTYSVTGVEQYYQNGLKKGRWVYVHYYGAHMDTEQENVKDASLLRVLSVSDIDPLNVPEPTPTPTPVPEGEEEETEEEQKLRAEIQTISTNTLALIPVGTENVVYVDISAIPAYFKGGVAPGACVNFIYTGEYDGETLGGLTPLGVTGEDPDSLSQSRKTATVTGIVLGTTANTVTMQTDDGVMIICSTEDVTNSSTGGLQEGSGIKVTFDAAASTRSNIYTALKIEDV
ncbi:MAG: hypothetical protein LUF78_00625 [Clostridiales bacterium]|nr:hypothetical protein [Clostridiales bacterium]